MPPSSAKITNNPHFLTRIHYLFPPFDKRERERERFIRIYERRKDRERDDDDDVHHDDKNDKKQTTIFIADCEESSTKRRRLFRVALTLAHTNGGSEKRRPGQTEIFTVHDLLFHPPSAANVRHAAAERARKRRSAVVTQSESARESRSESVAFVPAVEFRRREQTSTREDARVQIETDYSARTLSRWVRRGYG